MRCVLLFISASAGLGCAPDLDCPGRGPHEGNPAVWLWEGTQDEAPGCAEDTDVLWDGWRKGTSTAPESPTFARACAGVVRGDIPEGYTLCVIPSQSEDVCWKGYEDSATYVEEDGEEHEMCCSPRGNPPTVIPQSHDGCTT